MKRLAAFLGTSVGKKIVMAVSGAILMAFVVGHMLGNLQVYLGPKAFDAYAAFLRSVGHGGGIWVARAVILAAALAHVWGAVMTTLESWAARPQGYRVWQPGGGGSTLSSRTMRWTGAVIFGFVGYHLMHLTLGTAHPDFRDGQVFHNFVVGFQALPASLLYLAAMAALGLHIYHGGWSFLQTLGLSHARYNDARGAFALAVALVVVLVNVSFPASVLMGLVREASDAAVALLGR